MSEVISLPTRLEFQARLHVARDTPVEAHAASVLPVRIGASWWLLPAREVARVDSADALQLVPGAPQEVAGVQASGGTVYTVLDATVLVGDDAPSTRRRVVFLEPAANPHALAIALLVDQVNPLIPEPPRESHELSPRTGRRAALSQSLHRFDGVIACQTTCAAIASLLFAAISANAHHA